MNLTNDQIQALDLLIKFCSEDNNSKVFILRGSAGTGKTSLINSLLDNIPNHFKEVHLAALTNKAVKVIRSKTGRHPNTIHSTIYRIEDNKDTDIIHLKLRTCDSTNPQLFIFDEASMIGDKVQGGNDLFESRPLLTDIIKFVFSGNLCNKIIFIGDPCQLPPIGYEKDDEAPALNENYIRKVKSLTAFAFEMKEVIRHKDSYILENATELRDKILYNKTGPFNLRARWLDGKTPAVKQYLNLYDLKDEGKVSLLAWTNQDVNWWNRIFRERLHLTDLPLMPGTRVVIDRNWSDGNAVIFKGEIATVVDCEPNPITFAGLRFQNIVLETTDMEGVTAQHSALALIDHLESFKGLLSQEQERNLRHEAIKFNPKYREENRPWYDRHVGSFRLRYGYALTCHKAQGSEYKNVILHPYFPREDQRWLYTAITRAVSDLYSYKAA